MGSNQKNYNQTDLENIAKGACFLASGGGGTYESGRNLSDNFIKSDYYPNPIFDVIDCDQVEGDGYAVVVAYIGAPEAIKSANYPIGAVRAVEEVQRLLKSHGKKLKYVVPVEVGALSSVVPCLVASKLGLTVIDGDGAGRAVPELTMLSFSAAGISCSPAVLAGSDTNKFLLDLSMVDDDDHGQPLGQAPVVENIVRPVLALPQFKEIAGLAIWVMDSEQIHTAIKSKGTLTLAKETGARVTSESLDDVVCFLRSKRKEVFHLFHGTFDAKGCTSLTAGGFDHGTVTISDGDQQFIILYQNESLLGWSNQKNHPLVMAPDSISLFVEDEQKAYSIGDVMNEKGELSSKLIGKSVTVIGIAAGSFLRENGSNGLLPVFMQAIKNLGYYGGYKAIEKINQ